MLVSENIDKGKSILGVPLKQDKKEIKNPRAKKGNTQKPKQKKQHLCHHCEAAKHTQLNCYKWLATQQSNSMISSGNQNQFPPSFTPLQDLLKSLMFFSNWNGFNSSPSPPDQGFSKRKGYSKVWKEKGSKWFSHFFSLSPFLFSFLHYLCVCFRFWVSLVLCIALLSMLLFVNFSVVFFFFFYLAFH